MHNKLSMPKKKLSKSCSKSCSQRNECSGSTSTGQHRRIRVVELGVVVIVDQQCVSPIPIRIASVLVNQEYGKSCYRNDRTNCSHNYYPRSWTWKISQHNNQVNSRQYHPPPGAAIFQAWSLMPKVQFVQTPL